MVWYYSLNGLDVIVKYVYVFLYFCVLVQLAAFSTLKFNGGKPMVDTFRPVQPRKGRVVYRSHSGAAIPAIMFSFFLVVLRVFLALCLCNFY